MPNKQIVDTIKAHPEISYDEGWRQAVQAGLSAVDFQTAWAEAHGSSNQNSPDYQVARVLREMRRSDHPDWTMEDWAASLAAKDIGGEEVQLAFNLFRARGSLGPLTTGAMRRMIGLLVILAVAFGLWLSHKTGWGSLLWILASLVLYFVCYLALGAQFRDNAYKIIRWELGAVPLNPDAKLSEWRGAGFGFLGAENPRLVRLEQIEHGGRTAYLGEYVHWEGRLSYPVSRYVVAMELDRNGPSLHCVHEWKASSSTFRSPLGIDDPGLSRAFTCFAEQSKEAQGLLAKGLGAILSEHKVQSVLKSFEVVGNTMVLLFEPIQLQTDIRFAGPEVLYADYQYIRKGIRSRLELAKRIGATL